MQNGGGRRAPSVCTSLRREQEQEIPRRGSSLCAEMDAVQGTDDDVTSQPARNRGSVGITLS